MSSGFVAGTLVHTDKGLVPIQNLKVGDLVLSGDKNNLNGELAYKKVLQTLVFDKKEMIVRVAYHQEKKLAGNRKTYNIEKYYLYCTKRHPFWVTTTYSNGWDAPYTKSHWKSATKIEGMLHSFNRNEFWSEGIDYYTPLLKTNQENIAVQANLYRDMIGFRADKFINDDHTEELYGIIDFSSGKPTLLNTGTNNLHDWEEDQDIRHITLQEWFAMDAEPIYPGEIYPIDRLYEDKFFKNDLYENGFAEEAFFQTNVYNIEVEDYHTYFVNKHGILSGDSTIQGNAE